ncbi:MAG: aldo/keto reductase [Epsilonproteobacteria bacterium]|nr:aldo/keto reductase [Campylobacterota bacterium]OIO13625.1 MAG: oxidoreductase [Helicobacteraceae bacterium CG1_02_36_14]PIP10300.1 MAG: oxidoreductase [Sulfurimonas sp. CG23_combo_of_CG06-09_8_20_14_all_36_33]PIS26381.1 MAG: aldo/keto reductase [Sulfurimonas sp. CG08_land_8_20_14_0_20_36_33]PIU33843.1 MAG: aldo/keto reductase [Sulfurimonas sp. CG07_land_8_20_14_0_80_36_56]PIV03671.1 MAG: aldo/keto reductase [Sulfurimonas sp. CG03_land_8_20_14_0_80_36_25]PIV34186.1 MAG: aldo/keto reductase
MSNFAFGTYRISDLNPQHIAALREAIDSGITMIDTSSNYMDGGAERAIALALRSVDNDKKNRIKIVSKFGYIQNSNMQKHKEKPFEEVVEYSEDCFHSISQPFLHQQLSDSLERLEMDSIECYLIHNPEYYLLDAINRGVDKAKRLDEMYRRLFNAFVGLELEVQNKRIQSYGISSNSFSKLYSHEEFLPYEDLLTLAEKAADKVGNEEHSFTTIELPINILEQTGLKCAAWAKSNGLRVLANRPLNAEHEGFMYRLADYDESAEYYTHFNELMEVSDNDTLRPLYNLLEQLDVNKHKFGWLGDYDSFLYSQIIPHMRNSLNSVSEENREVFFNFIELFLQEYRKMVAYECSKSTKIKFKDLFNECSGSMQECSLRFLMNTGSIDYILVGMRKESYVHEILPLLG